MRLKLTSFLALLLAAGAADAQCVGSSCSLVSSVRTKTVVRTRATQTVAAAPQVVAVTDAPQASARVSSTVEVRQRTRLFRR